MKLWNKAQQQQPHFKMEKEGGEARALESHHH